MRAAFETFRVLTQFFGGIVLFGFLVYAPIAAGAGFGMVGMLFVSLINGWAVYAFLRYRQGCRREFAHLLAAAVNGNFPLETAVRAYVNDRPSRGPLRPTLEWIGCCALPLYAYTRLWIGWRQFDHLVEEVAERLEDGHSLSEALDAVPNVADRETRLAVAIGEETSSLAASLRGLDRERWSAVWLEIAPRLAYPFAVLVFVGVIATFLMAMILPKFHRIFDEFGEAMPPETVALVQSWEIVEEFLPLLPFAFLAFAVVAATIVSNAAVRWHTPVVGRLYRWGVQADVLRALGRLLAAGQTVPASLEFLELSRTLPRIVRRRLRWARADAERGETLDAALGAAGLLPSSMRPLVRSAQRVGTLPWALGELGEHLAGRAVRLVRKVSLVAAPLLVVAVGAVVAFIAVGMFLPLIQLLTRLSE